MLTQTPIAASSTVAKQQARGVARLPTSGTATTRVPCASSRRAAPASARPVRKALRVSAAAATSSGATAAGGKPAKVIDHVYDAIVVGGGLSGLVTGQALAAQHGMSNFLVTEARERVGGNITSMSGDGYVWEEGPNSFQPNDSMLQVAVSTVEEGGGRGGGGGKGKAAMPCGLRRGGSTRATGFGRVCWVHVAVLNCLAAAACLFQHTP